MKKLGLTLITAVLLALFAFSANAEEKEGNFYYEVINNEAKITYCVRNGEIDIPDTLGGYPVTSIGCFAFSSSAEAINDWTIRIKIPASVTSIEDYAFANCCELQSIIVDEDNEFYSSEDGVLFNKNKTELIRYPVRMLTEYIIPDTVTVIGKAAFEECGLLTDVTMPDGLKIIGDNAFRWCYNLTDITIPDGVTSIGSQAFRSCEKLTSITIPDSVTELGSWVFSGCISLQSIIIGDGVTSICDRAFGYCYNLTSITIPDGVTSIGSSAFSGCSSLQGVTIPNSVTSIGSGAFNSCTSLVDVYYDGYKDHWKNIVISDFNDCLTEATMHFNPHTHLYDDVSVTAPTCTMGGYTTHSCLFCNEGYEDNFTEKLGHKYSSVYTTDIKATCTKTGSRSKHCIRDGCTAKTSVNSIAKTAHSYKTVTIKATLTKNGKVETKCSVCGYVSKTTTVYYPKTIKLSKTEYTYNGKVQTPSVTVKDSKGNTLKKDTDYTVKYESGRKAPGKYTVTITFKGKYSGTKKLTYTIAPKATSKVTATSTTTTITLKWNKVTGADGYRIYKYNSKTKTYEKYKDVTGTTLKISKLKAGTKYKFKVRAFTKDDGTIMGAYSPIFETATKAKTPTLKATSTKKRTASLSWTNVTGESGYQVYYATKKSGEYKKLNSYKVNVVKSSKSKLTSGKTYYFKVRAYTKTDSGTVYSAWSTVKSVKIR